MKKLFVFLIILLIAIISIIVLLKYSMSEKSITYTENFRLIVKFEKSIDDGKSLIIKRNDLQSKNINKLLKKYEIQKIKAVFTNRYSEIGELKPGLRNPNSNGTFRRILINDINKARELSQLLKNEKGVLSAIIETPIRFKPFETPDDIQYGDQWYLHSSSHPTADIDAELAWNINQGRNDVIIAVCDGGIDYNHSDLDPGNRSRIIVSDRGTASCKSR